MDVVLNSLSGDGVECSIRALADDGRFVELGKRDIWSDARFHAVRPRSQYFVMDVAAECARHPEEFGQMLRELAAEFDTGALVPLPRRVFDWKQVGAAFRLMSRAEHIGKIIVTQRPTAWRMSAMGEPALRSDATYLITGGLGGLGLLIAGWMIEHGARHLMLIGRHAPTPDAGETIDRLRANGATISVAQVDVSRETELSAVLAKAALEMPALKGVIHAAGALDDGALHRQEWSRFQAVMAAKVYGSLNLHRLTCLPLDFFMMFSSAASMLRYARPEQPCGGECVSWMPGSYCAEARGLPAPRHQLGRVGRESGRLPSARWESYADSRLRPISPQQGLALLETLLAAASPGGRVWDGLAGLCRGCAGHGRRRSCLAGLAGGRRHEELTRAGGHERGLRR